MKDIWLDVKGIFNYLDITLLVHDGWVFVFPVSESISIRRKVRLVNEDLHCIK